MATSSPPDRFVLDGSVALAWLFQDEQDPESVDDDERLCKLAGPSHLGVGEYPPEPTTPKERRPS